MASEVPRMIADYRRARGLTLQALGDKLGVHWETVWRWEHGKRTPPGRLVQLALRGLDDEEREPKRRQKP
jgi:transcriptional regulator with XRE-family HTH domain